MARDTQLASNQAQYERDLHTPDTAVGIGYSGDRTRLPQNPLSEARSAAHGSYGSEWEFSLLQAPRREF